jgi:hypothetical protein
MPRTHMRGIAIYSQLDSFLTMGLNGGGRSRQCPLYPPQRAPLPTVKEALLSLKYSSSIYGIQQHVKVQNIQFITCRCYRRFQCCTEDKPIPVAARSKAWAFGRAFAGIVGSNPSGGMHVCLLSVFVSCLVEVSVTDRSLAQKSPTECGVCLSMI